jgi:hypothetical protein
VEVEVRARVVVLGTTSVVAGRAVATSAVGVVCAAAGVGRGAPRPSRPS